VAGYDPPLWFDRLAGVSWRFLAVAGALCVIVLFVVGLGSVILPAFLGLLFASGLRPINTALRRRGAPPAVAALSAVAVLTLIVIAVVWTTIRAVADEWGAISFDLQTGLDRLVQAAVDAGAHQATSEQLADQFASAIGTIVKWMIIGTAHVLPVVASVATTVLLSLVVAFFFMKDGAWMWRRTVAAAAGSSALLDQIGQRIWKTISGYILGQAAIATIDATLISLGALLLGVPHVGAIALVTFLGAFVPYIGAFIAGTLAVMLAVAEGGVARGAAMLAVVIVVQVFEGNVLQPWIQGRAVHLHPLVVALSVVAGGALAGFLGVFLAVPVTASIAVALDELRGAGMLGQPVTTDPLIEKHALAAPHEARPVKPSPAHGE
jgi:predicted PurR-regulated permease PerM